MLPQLSCCGDVNELVDLLKDYDIDAVLLMPATPGCPENRLPDHYGIEEQSSFPAGIAGQFAYPFRK